MSSISGVGGFNSFASSIFSKIDTKGQGYISKSDLQSAYDTASSSSSSNSSTSSVDELFTQLDSNGDSKVTKDEFTQGLQKLASQLDSQYNSMRMGNSGGMPPPPPPDGAGQAGNDQGFTKDQLTSMASDSASIDSKMSNVFSTIAKNFDKADTNGDGKVDRKETMAFMQSQQDSTASSSLSTSSTSTVSDTSSTSSSSSASSTSSAQDQLLAQLMQIIRAYGMNDNSTTSLFSAQA